MLGACSGIFWPGGGSRKVTQAKGHTYVWEGNLAGTTKEEKGKASPRFGRLAQAFSYPAKESWREEGKSSEGEGRGWEAKDWGRHKGSGFQVQEGSADRYGLWHEEGRGCKGWQEAGAKGQEGTGKRFLRCCWPDHQEWQGCREGAGCKGWQEGR